MLLSLVKFIHLKQKMTTQERQNVNLAAENSTPRKQVAQLQAREIELKKMNDSLEQELAMEKVAREAAEKECADHLSMMKSILVDTTLHDCTELMEEFKAGK